MKTSTKFCIISAASIGIRTVKLDNEEMCMLRDLVRIGMRSKYYQDFVSKECDDIDEKDHQTSTTLVVNQFINLYSSGPFMDKHIFEGVE